MKGSHQVETFLRWLDTQDNIPLFTRVALKSKIKGRADLASATGKTARLDIKRGEDVVMAMRFFDDGSMEVGWPEDLKWMGDEQPFVPPEEKEI